MPENSPMDQLAFFEEDSFDGTLICSLLPLIEDLRVVDFVRCLDETVRACNGDVLEANRLGIATNEALGIRRLADWLVDHGHADLALQFFTELFGAEPGQITVDVVGGEVS